MIPAAVLAFALAGPPPLATLGHAKMVCGEDDRLFATPDGKHAVTHRGEWFDLDAGRRVAPPFPLPDGGTIHSVLEDGTVVVEAAQQLHFYPPGERKPKRVLDTLGRRVRLTPDGSAAVCLQGWTDDTVTLLAADLSGKKPGGWKTVADELPPVVRVAVSDTGSHAAVLFGGHGDAAVHGLRAKSVVSLPAPRRKPSPPGLIECYDSNPRTDVSLSGDGAIVYIANGGGIVSFDATTREALNGDTFIAHAHGLTLAQADIARRFETLTGHRAFVGDGSKVVRLTEGGVIRLFDTFSGEQLDPHSTYRPLYGVKALDDRRAVAWTDEGRIVTWDIATGKVVADVTVAGAHSMYWGSDVTFSPDRATVIARRGYIPLTIHADAKTGKNLRPIDDDLQLLFGPDGGVWAVPVTGGELSKLGAENPRVAGVVANGTESRLLFDPAGRLAVSARAGGLWVSEMASGKLRWKADAPGRHGSGVLAAAVTKREVMVAWERGVTVFDLATHKLLRSFEFDGDERRLATLSAGGRWLAVVEFGRHREAFTLFPLDHPDPLTAAVELPIRPTSETTALAFTPDGKRLLTKHRTGVAHAWDNSAFTSGKANPREDELWAGLAADDAEDAGRVTAELVQTPRAAVALLAKRLTPATTAKEPADWPRQARAVEVLEQIGGPGAERVLRRLAGGAPGAKLTDEAARAVRRLTPPPGPARE